MAGTADVPRPLGPEILAVVTEAERPLMTTAARLLSECLGAATGSPPEVRLTFADAARSDFLAPDGPEIPDAAFEHGLMSPEARDVRSRLYRGRPRIVVLSLLADVQQRSFRDRQGGPRFFSSPDREGDWTATQRDWVRAHFEEEPLLDVRDAGRHWRAIIDELRKGADGVGIFLGNVFRHVPGGPAHRYRDDPEMLGERIRRFNLMAAELSHETGLCVVDLDRALAHVGARAIRTDYRLGGEGAATAGAFAIVSALLWAGLDEEFAPEALERARTLLEARRAATAWRTDDSARDGASSYRPYLKPNRSNGKPQIFAPSGDLSLGWNLRRVLREVRDGRIGVIQASGMVLEKVVHGVRRPPPTEARR